MSVSGKILRGAGWMTVASILARLGAFVANLIVIRILGLELVGQWGLIESWLSLAIMFALFGLATAETRYIARYLETDVARVGEVAGASLLIGLGFSVIVALFAAAGLSAFPLDQPGAGEVGLVGATQAFWVAHAGLLTGLIIVSTLREITLALLHGLQAFHLFVYLNLLTGFLSVPLYYSLTQADGVTGVLTARWLLATAETLLALLLARHVAQRLGTRLSLHRFAENTRALFGFALPTFLGQLIANPAKTVMVSYLAAQPGGAVQVGLLATAGRLVGLASALPGSIASVLMPILATVWGHGQRDRFRHGMLSALRIMWLVSLPILLFFMAATPTLLGWLFGPEYVAASTVTFVMLVVALLTMINETPDRTLAAAGRQWLSTANNLLWVVLFIGLCLWLMPDYLAAGYAMAFLISFAVYVIWQLGMLNALFQMPLRPLVALAGSSLFLSFVAWYVTEVSVPAVQVLLAGGLAFGTLVLEWKRFLTVEERHELRQQIRYAWARARVLASRDWRSALVS